MTIEISLHAIKKPSLHFNLVESFTFQNKKHSYFGGIPYDQEIHNCSLCNEKMDFIMQLFFPETNENSDSTLYSLFYCNNCRPFSGGEGFKLNCLKNPDFSNCIYDKYLRSPFDYAFFDFKFSWNLPDWEYLDLISKPTKDFYSLFEKLNPIQSYYHDLHDICDKSFVDSFNFLGGYPKFLDEAIFPVCNDSCRKQYELFFQLDSQIPLKHNWNNNGCLFVFKCPDEEKFKFFIQ